MDKEGVKALIDDLSSSFVGRGEEAKVAVLSLLTKNHCVLLGEPGTAKSAVIRKLTESVGGNYYFYLLSKYTIPDELTGAIDPIEYKKGNFKRQIKDKMPTANVVFLDEIFKASSETLNTILSVMNERTFVDSDGTRYKVPLYSMFSASNELPQSDDLQAFYDRILIKQFVKPIDPSIIGQGLLQNIQNIQNNNGHLGKNLSLQEVDDFYGQIQGYMIQNASGVSKVVENLVNVLKMSGVTISDRTAMHPGYFPMLVSAYSYIFDMDLKKSAISVSKYVLQNEDEQMEAYQNALDSMYPAALREAQTKLEEAQSKYAGLHLAEARESALQALQQIKDLMDKKEVMEMFRDEIRDITKSADNIVKEITNIQNQTGKYKKRVTA